MKSKKSFYNSSIIKADLKRFWPLWSIILIYTLLSNTLYTFLNITDILSAHTLAPNYKEICQELIFDNISCHGAFISVFLFAPIVAVLCFSYLYKTQTSYTLHSLPIRRSTLLFSHMISSFLIIAVPYTISFGLMALISIFNGLGMVANIIAFILELYIVIAFFLSMAITVCMLSGNAIISLGIYGVLNALVYMGILLFSRLLGNFSVNIHNSNLALEAPIVKLLTPIYYITDKADAISYYTNSEIGWAGYKAFDYSIVTRLNLQMLVHFAIFIIPTVILILIARLLYNHRRLETVGDSLCFSWSKPVFRTVFTYFAAILLTHVIDSIFYSISYSSSYNDVIVMQSVIIVISTFVAFSICDMILEGKFLIWKKLNIPQLIVMFACMLILYLSFSKLPDKPTITNLDNITYARIFYNGGMYTYSGDDLDDSIIALETAVLNENNRCIKCYDIKDLYDNCLVVSFFYYLDDNSEFYQYYYIDKNSTAASQISNHINDLDRSLESIGLNDTFRDSLYMIYVSDNNNYASDSENITSYTFKSPDDINRIYDAILEDIYAGNISLVNMNNSDNDDFAYLVQLSARYSAPYCDPDVFIRIDDGATNTLNALNL